MSAAFSYPRIPHLVDGRGTADDLVLGRREREALLGVDLMVEEKLDGANVMVWVDDGILQCSGRAGPGSIDRAGQFGALRAWTATNFDRLQPLLAPGSVLYGEWLYLTHTVAYRDLPSWFVALDLRGADGSYVDGQERREVLASTGLAAPPLLGTGRFDLDGLEELALRSKWSDGAAEGVVVRPVEPFDPDLRVAKLVRAGFERIADDEWRRGRGLNTVVPSSA
ncbi:MAG: RNA ligase family protein [Acidimicrobiales bacterium]|nr:RNA ligase family protein [Acidimicrobiales bacterium]